MAFSARTYRCVSFAPQMGGKRLFSTSSYNPKIDASNLLIQKTTTPRTKSAPEKLVFGREFADHMFEVDWTAENGWEQPKIIPYQNLSLAPSCSVFHYAIELFEGMKAYKDAKGRVRLFRPEKNWERFNNSAKRLALPTINIDGANKCLKELVKLDKDWVPSSKGYSLYLRPTLIGTQPTLGVSPSNSAKMFIISSPVGPYYPEGWKPVKLLADDTYVRAWPGGTGGSKLGCNYAPGILPALEASKRGYSQILWLFGPEHYITEVGTMNMFIFWTNEKGQKELVTPPLDGTILPGVTRDSIIDLAKEWKEFAFTERSVPIKEFLKALKEDRVHESFGAGTAAVVSPIQAIHYQGTDYKIPLDKSDPNAPIGPLTKRFAQTIMSIQYGDIEHPWSVVVD